MPHPSRQTKIGVDGPSISTLTRDERDPPSRRARGASGHLADRAKPSLQSRSRAGPACGAQLVHLQLRRVVDQHGALHPDLHARLGTDGQRHELVAGTHHDSARQHDRPRADPPQLSSGHEIRHPVSRVRSRGVRHGRIESPGVDARARRVRLVWHPGVDRRRSAADLLQRVDARLAAIGSAAASPDTRRPNGCRS